MIKYRASKLKIKEVDSKEEKQFLIENHYQGYVASRVCYGLYNGNELLCLMSFGKPRYNRRYDWELLRLCTKKDYQVYGGASKLFKHFCNSFSGSVLSYCNKSHFSGKVYESIGMTLLGECKSYHYEKDGMSFHRSNFMKCKLVKLYPQYSNLTEEQIMWMLGFTKVPEIQATFVFGVKWYIYKITNNINGKTYIGQHLDRGDDYWGSGTNIKRAIAKYGKENFTKEILLDDIKSQKEADKFEIKFINEAKAIGKAEYNIQTVSGPHVSSRSAGLKREANKAFLDHSFKKGNIPWNKGSYGYKIMPRTNESKERSSNAIKQFYDEHPEAKKSISERMKGNNNAKAYSLWKCIETGEIKSATEWKALGFRVYKKKTKGKTFENIR